MHFSFQVNETKSPVIDAQLSPTKEAAESTNNIEIISIKSDDTDMEKSIEEKFKETSEEIVVSNDESQQKELSTQSTPIEDSKNTTTERANNSNESRLEEDIAVQETSVNVTEAPIINIPEEACSSLNENNDSDNVVNKNPLINEEISSSNDESLSKVASDRQAASDREEVNETANDDLLAAEETAVKETASALADFESELPKTVHILQSKVSGLIMVKESIDT